MVLRFTASVVDYPSGKVFTAELKIKGDSLYSDDYFYVITANGADVCLSRKQRYG